MDDIKVINIDPVTRVVTLGMSSPPEKVSGLMKLVQVVVLALLNSPGRSGMYPHDGSGIPSMIGQFNLSASDSTQALAEISEKVEKVKDEIIAHQAPLVFEDQSERLVDFSAVSVEQGTNIDTAVVKFKVISEGGDVANFAI